MLEPLQQAYETALKNVVVVNFAHDVSNGGNLNKQTQNLLKLEIAKEKACCQDVITAINHHLIDGRYDLVKTQMAVVQKSIDYIEHLEDQLKEQRRNNLFEIASFMGKRGYSAKVVRFDG